MQTIIDLFNVFQIHQDSWSYNIIGLVVGMLLLFKGGDWLVDSSSALAKKLGISPMIIGLTIVAFGTSCPELLVSTISGLQGESGVAIGNVVGSNFTNIALILGLAALLKPIAVDSTTLEFSLNPKKWKNWGPFAITMICSLLVLPLSLCFGDRAIIRYEGLFLILLIVLFTWRQIHVGRKEHKALKEELSADNEINEEATDQMATGKAIIILLISIFALVAGAKALVDSGVGIARKWGVPELIIGLTIIALGTSLPELAASVIGILKGEDEIALGNILGSNIFNILAVLGVSSTIHPIGVDEHAIIFDTTVMLAITLLLGLLMVFSRHFTKDGSFGLSRFSGSLLLIFYIVYTIGLYLQPEMKGSIMIPIIMAIACLLFMFYLAIAQPSAKKN